MAISDEHFTVDGTLIDAWASHKSFRKKDEKPEDRPPPDDPGNPSIDFHGEKRTNATHASTTDPEAKRPQVEQHRCTAGAAAPAATSTGVAAPIVATARAAPPAAPPHGRLDRPASPPVGPDAPPPRLQGLDRDAEVYARAQVAARRDQEIRRGIADSQGFMKLGPRKKKEG